MQHFSLRERKHLLLLSFLNISEAGKQKKLCLSVILSQNAIIYAVKKVVRLDGCVAFSQIEPKTSNLEWKSSSCDFSEWNSEKSEMSLFPLRN